MKTKITATNLILVSILIFIIGGIIWEKSGSSNNAGTSSTLGKANGLQALVGKPAPAFALTDRQGNAITNDSIKGKKAVLFFNEGLACYPACWNQMLEFGKDERFKNSDTVVLSVVTDSKESWQQATTKMPDLATINVGFDSAGSASSKFGATTAPSTMHPGSPGHSYVIVDSSGIVRYVLDDPNMAINNGELYVQLSKIQ